MSHTNGRAKRFCARVLCIDDNFDVLELEKSILKKETDDEVLLASNGAGLNMARGTLIDLVHAEENRSSTHKVITCARANFQECAIHKKPFFV